MKMQSSWRVHCIVHFVANLVQNLISIKYFKVLQTVFSDTFSHTFKMTSKLSGINILNSDTTSCQAEQNPSTLLDEQIHSQQTTGALSVFLPHGPPPMSFFKITIVRNNVGRSLFMWRSCEPVHS